MDTQQLSALLNTAGLTTGSGGLNWPNIIGGLIFGMVGIQKLLRSLRRPEMYGMSRERVVETWAQILSTAEQGIMGAKLAVMEADKLLDAALKSMVLPGETLGERLKSAQYKYPDIRRVWGAHRLRNQLVHDSSFQISIGQAKRALKDYEAALKVLNIL